MLAKFNTKSNFKNLNGKWLLVHEAASKRITCTVRDEALGGRYTTIDFTISELIELKTSPTTNEAWEAQSVLI